MLICVFLEQVVHGKSFYIKSLILRYRLLGVSQFIIDPEREYDSLCKNLSGSLIKLRANIRKLYQCFRYTRRKYRR